MMQFNVLKLLLTKLKTLNYLKQTLTKQPQSVQNAEQALHGAEKLNQDKQTSSTELDGLTDLTDAQRENSENKLTLLIVEMILSKIEQAKALNDAMKKLKEQVAQKDGVHANSDYTNEDSAQKMRIIMHLNKRKTLLITAQILT